MSFYFPPPYFIYRKENYAMASVVFLFLFFQTHFANLQFSTICDMPSAFLDFGAIYLRAYWLECSNFFKNLYGKVANDSVPNFRCPKIFHPEVICENKLKKPKVFRANRWTWLASVPRAYVDCLCWWNWCEINRSGFSTSLKKMCCFCGNLAGNFKFCKKIHVYGQCFKVWKWLGWFE